MSSKDIGKGKGLQIEPLTIQGEVALAGQRKREAENGLPTANETCERFEGGMTVRAWPHNRQ